MPGVDFTNIFARLFRANNLRSFFWQMAFGKWQTVSGNGPLIWRISPQLIRVKFEAE